MKKETGKLFLRIVCKSKVYKLQAELKSLFISSNVLIKYMKHVLALCIMLNIIHSVKAQDVYDTSAIKQLLEKESDTWRSGDIQAHADCWQIQPYSKILVSTLDGKSFVVPPELMLHPPAGMAGKGGSAVNSNYTFSVHDNNAWVSHDEVSTTKDGVKSYSHEIRILERINGQWKLVAQSIHMYKPEDNK